MGGWLADFLRCLLGFNVLMPRKKPACPEPIEVNDFGDVIVYVYPDDRLPFARGMSGHLRKMETLSLILQLLIDLRDDARRGFRKQSFANVRSSAIELATAFEKLYPKRHGRTVLIRACRLALSIYALTGDDNMRKQYLDAVSSRVPVADAKRP